VVRLVLAPVAFLAALAGAPHAAAAQSAQTTVAASANLRTKPGGGKALTRLRAGTPVTITCQQVGGVAVTRRDGPSRIWSRVTVNGRRGWVADGLLRGSTQALAAPLCGIPAATAPAPPGVIEGTCGITAPVVLVPPFPTPEAFIAAALPGARRSRATYRVPVSVTLAQGILETGGGKIAALANNWFGLKAQPTGVRGRYRWEANAVGCVLKKTRESERGRLVLTVGAFRAYTGLEQSILDHGARLTINPVYRPAFRHTDEPRRFLREVARRYATDPNYAAKLLALVKRYDLERYD
jgi:flagellar protein FlgJ